MFEHIEPAPLVSQQEKQEGIVHSIRINTYDDRGEKVGSRTIYPPCKVEREND